jgi:hypothetical protein
MGLKNDAMFFGTIKPEAADSSMNEETIASQPGRCTM